MDSYNYEVRDGKVVFTDLPEGKDFIAKLTAAFSPANFRIVNYDDLWMQDEIVLNAATDSGDFMIYRDAAGFYFINPGSITLHLLDEMLRQSPHFYTN